MYSSWNRSDDFIVFSNEKDMRFWLIHARYVHFLPFATPGCLIEDALQKTQIQEGLGGWIFGGFMLVFHPHLHPQKSPSCNVEGGGLMESS